MVSNKPKSGRSLAETHPELAAQAHDWDPRTVKSKSNQRKSWICDFGHVWTTVVSHRTRGHGCPICSNHQVLAGFNDVATTHPIVAQQAYGWDTTKYVSGSRARLEWICSDGHIWAATLSDRVLRGTGCPYCSGRLVIKGTNDLATLLPDLALEADGWDPTTVKIGSNKKVTWRCTQGHSYIAGIDKRSSRSGCPICSNHQVLAGFNDLATTDPELAGESDGWDPTTIKAGSNKKLTWKGKCGHGWDAVVSSRALNGRGCPVCVNKKILIGFNDLAITHPEIAAQADGWDPTTVSAGHDRALQWKCESNHSYSSRVYSRTGKLQQGCPICSNNQVLVGFNDLATTHPEIAAQADGWDPSTITFGSGLQKTWRCKNAHLWKATITSVVRGSGCTVCLNRLIISGLNDLATTHPEIAAQTDGWDPTTIGSGHGSRKAWKCSLGHFWKTSPSNRTLQDTKCPVCSGRQLETGFNDLQTKFPDVAAQADGWDPTTINAGTNKKMKWKCSENHRWNAAVSSRTSLGSGCPSCAIYGFDPNKISWLYLIENFELSMQQIGITNDPNRRLAEHGKGGWEVFELRGPMDGHLTQQLETSCLHALEERGAILGNKAGIDKFDGYTEAWTKASLNVTSIKQILDWVYEDDERLIGQKNEK